MANGLRLIEMRIPSRKSHQPSAISYEPLRSPSLQKRPQLAAARRMSQLPERFRLDLADALARDREALAHFLERVLAAVADAEAHLDHLLLARRQRLQHRLGLLFQVQVDDRLGG